MKSLSLAQVCEPPDAYSSGFVLNTEDSFELVDSSEDGTLVARWSRIRELRSLVRFGATGSFEADCAV